MDPRGHETNRSSTSFESIIIRALEAGEDYFLPFMLTSLGAPEEARSSPRETVRAVTHVARPFLCPELELRLAPEPLGPWEATERATGQVEPPPFWAHAWPGGLALARSLFDAPEVVEGRAVLDFASGCGVSAIAAARCGARSVTATEVDAFALAAIALNAELNGVRVEALARDVIGLDEAWDVVLVGDVFYQRELAARVGAWLDALAARGALVLIGDPGRSFLPQARLRCVATFSVCGVPEWDSVVDRPARVWRVGTAATGVGAG